MSLSRIQKESQGSHCHHVSAKSQNDERKKIQQIHLFMCQDKNEQHKNKYVTDAHYRGIRLRTPFRGRFVPALVLQQRQQRGKIRKNIGINQV